MYESFAKEQFGVNISFKGSFGGTDPLSLISTAAFEQLVEYRTVWGRAQKCMEALASSAAEAAEYMRKHGRPYDVMALPTESVESVTRKLVDAYNVTKRLLVVCEAMQAVSQ